MLALGCGGADQQDRSEPVPREPTRRPPAEGPAPAPAVPDGGTERGHGNDDDDAEPRERGSIVVPDTDRTPPEPTVLLLDVAGNRDGAARAAVTLPPGEPFVVTAIGRDRNGGMGRTRVAIRASLLCRGAGGRSHREPFVRYVPPPQISRVKLVSGTRTRTALIQRVRQRFGESDCERGELEAFRGEAWADTTNASGLDATSRHIRFRGGIDG